MRLDREQLTSPLAVGSTAFLTTGAIDLLAGGGPAGLIFLALPASLAVALAVKAGVLPSLAALTAQAGVAPSEPEAGEEEAEEPVYTGTRSIVDRLLGNYPLSQSPETEEVQQEGSSCIDMEEEELTPPVRTASFVFSSLLPSFRPTLHNIYLASLPDGTPLVCAAKDLCHVAIAGSTGHGKSSITRLLMSQLCYAGASVLLLDPHYTAYDVETGDDWTPFTPYLVYDPLECCTYPVIEHYLRQIATVMIPGRLQRRRQGKKMGKPYFVVLDELPAIVAHIKGASGYLATILREGRKVGVFVISASQGFLIKTMFPEGDSAVRDCYQTAYDVGGDARSSLALLGLPAAKMPAVRLGKGTVMLRNGAHPARLARVPLTDNAALYRLLGPSTYVPETGDEDDNLFLEHLSPQSVPVLQRPAPQEYGYGMRRLHAVAEPEPMEELPVKEPAKQVRVPEVDFPRISAISHRGNTPNTGNEAGNGVEMAPQADADNFIDEVFPVSREQGEMRSTSVKPDVSDEKLEIIRRMKEKKFQDNEIASLLGLAGRKYGLYRHCLVYLGYTQTKEG